MSLTRFALTLSALALAAAGAVAQPAQPAQPAPSEAELEYWRSVQRIDTADAYRSYLASFPSGLFSGLARLKLAAPATPASAKASEPPALQAAASSGSLRSFSEPLANSSAVSLNLGDRLNGPGLVTVGAVGARKQIVLPPGEWVLLAAADRKSVQATIPYSREYPIGITTLTFGRFASDRLAALIRVTSSRQIANVNSWTDFEGCDRSMGSAGLAHARTRVGLRDECSALRVENDPSERLFAASEELKASLGRLGARMSGAAVVSSLSFGDSRLGYLGISRLDWPGTALGAAADRATAWRAPGIEGFPAHQNYLTHLDAAWQGYRKLATDGFQRAFESPDLVPNVPARPNAELSGLADFAN